MRTVRCFFVVLLLIQIVGIFELKGQQYLENYPGIPIISESWELRYKNYPYHFMKEAGITAITATIVNKTIFDSARVNGLKIIPYPDSTTAGFMVAKYTDAAYTVWEAEGDADSSEYATLSRAGSDTCDTYNDNGTQCIITTANLSGAPNEAVVLWGPGYTQQNKYIIREDTSRVANVRKYDASFRLKMIEIIPTEDIEELADSVICRLRVYAKNDLGSEYTIKDTSIKVSDLILNGWKEIKTRYTLDTLPLDYYHSYEKPEWAKIINIEDFVDTVKFAERILFEVTWEKVSNLRLLVDKITCYDERGWELKHDEYTQNRLVHQVNNTGDDTTNPKRLKNITQADFDSTCIGWMALSEPQTIDHYEPVRFIDSIINISSGGTRRMFVATCASWNASGFPSGIYFYRLAAGSFTETKKMMLIK